MLISTNTRGSSIAGLLAAHTTPGWTTRFAPAPTGWLHLGHAVNAVFVWGLARALSGRVLLRIEDHDRGRCRPEYERGLLEDLDWLGLVPDGGTTTEFRAGAHPQRQSDRADVYESALTRLAESSPGLVYACACSRRDVAAQSGDIAGVETPYPGTCRSRNVDGTTTSMRRVIMQPAVVVFEDLACGQQMQEPARQCGDVLVRDRSGNWTYQFAVAVDDVTQQVDVIIRGEDLLASTGRQVILARLLGRTRAPLFLHHQLVMRDDGAKLSKSDGATGLRELRAAGWSPERVLGEAARLAGLQETARPLAASALAALFRSS